MIQTRKKRRREKFWTGSGKFFLSLIIIYLLYFAANKIYSIAGERSDFYKKSDIQINGNRLISETKILDICGFESNDDSEIRINVDSLAARIMKLKNIKGVSITHRPPRILNITIEEYEPVAFIYGRGLNLIDADGYLIPIPTADIVWDLPLISGIKSSLGVLGSQTIAPDAYLALEIFRYLEDENPLLLGLVSEINLSKRNAIEIYLIKGGTKIRISRDFFYRELFILNNYIANYLDWRHLSSLDYIDLRFENQLIVKSKT